MSHTMLLKPTCITYQLVTRSYYIKSMIYYLRFIKYYYTYDYTITMIYDQEVDLLKIYCLSSIYTTDARRYVELTLRVKVISEIETKVVDNEIVDVIRKGYVHRTAISREFHECTRVAHSFRRYCRDMIIALTLYHYIKTELSENLDLNSLLVTKTNYSIHTRRYRC